MADNALCGRNIQVCP